MSRSLDPQRLHVAHHELGHYTAWQKLNLTVADINVTGYGNDTEGQVSLGKRAFRTPEQLHAYLVGLLAGREADRRYCERTHARFRDYHSRADLTEFRHAHKHRWVSKIPPSELRIEARELVHEHWNTITRLSLRLAERGTL